MDRCCSALFGKEKNPNPLANLIFCWHPLQSAPDKGMSYCSQEGKKKGTKPVGAKSYIIKNEHTTQFSMTFVYAILKSLSKAEKQWLFIKLIASVYSFRISYCFSSKYTSSSNISCIQFCLNEYIIGTIINFFPSEQGSALLNSFPV